MIEFFPPYRNMKEKKNGFIYISISIILFFIFDYCYELNIFYLRDVCYYKNHTIPAFLYSISNIPFIITVMYTLARWSRGIEEWFKYLASFVIDICVVYGFFAFRDPSMENMHLNTLVILSIGIFLMKLILFAKCKRFKNMKMS